MTNRLKLLILGYGRHGKDTVCEILKEAYGYTFESSSYFCSNLFIYEQLKDKYNYNSHEDCYLDRHNHRQEWYEAISEYNTPDSAKLGIEIFKKYNIYCGLRNKKEFHALRNTGAFDYAIWVDRSDHLPPEDKKSITVEPWMADYIIDNNDNLSSLKYNTNKLIEFLHSIN